MNEGACGRRRVTGTLAEDRDSEVPLPATPSHRLARPDPGDPVLSSPRPELPGAGRLSLRARLVPPAAGPRVQTRRPVAETDLANAGSGVASTGCGATGAGRAIIGAGRRP